MSPFMRNDSLKNFINTRKGQRNLVHFISHTKFHYTRYFFAKHSPIWVKFGIRGLLIGCTGFRSFNKDGKVEGKVAATAVVVVVVVIVVVVVVKRVMVSIMAPSISRSLLFHCITSPVLWGQGTETRPLLATRLKRLPILTFCRSLGLRHTLPQILYLLLANTGQ